MKILLAAINSKYIHTSLSVREICVYLNSKGVDAEICEYSINSEVMRIAADIVKRKPEVLGISCYIWNAKECLELADIVKKADKNIRIVFGGPQAEYNAEKYLEKYNFIDTVIKGEGETAFEMMAAGVQDKIICGEKLPLDEKPFPYTDDELQDKNKIFYYETSKGCPFSCSYCLSSAEKGIRYKSVKNTLSELKKFADAGVRVVKLVDRTFNSDLKRSCEILKGILDFDTETQFHFEIAADRADDEFIEILSKFGRGNLRIEAGLQSINEKTLSAVRRKCDVEKLAENTEKILEKTNAVFHLDLIAGLPYEDMESFKKSFDFAFSLNPHELQLGFLKVLPGTLIEKEAELHGILYSMEPPYEIIANKYISFFELSKLKRIEAVLDMLHNSGIMKNAERELLGNFESPFAFFEAMAEFMENKGFLDAPHQRADFFSTVHEFIVHTGINDCKEELAKDFLLSCRGATVPEWFKEGKVLEKEKIYAVLADDEKIAELKKLKSVKSTQRHKTAKVISYGKKIWLISYADGRIIDITDVYERVEL